MCIRDRYTPATAVSHLLYYCITKGGWVDRFVGVTDVLRAAVVQGCGWVDRFVPMVCCCGVSMRGLFLFLLFFLPLYRPRHAGVVQRTTINYVPLLIAINSGGIIRHAAAVYGYQVYMRVVGPTRRHNSSSRATSCVRAARKSDRFAHEHLIRFSQTQHKENCFVTLWSTHPCLWSQRIS